MLINNLGSNYASILLGEDTAFQAVGAGSNPTTRSKQLGIGVVVAHRILIPLV